MLTRRLLPLLLVFFVFACTEPAPTPESTTSLRPIALEGPQPDPFGDYWYQGKAEITSYTLEQARYGEIHDGTAVLIFVTEPFSRTKQVKLDYPDRTPDDAVNVMKVNFTKNFLTGVYPYSMMMSAFTPIDRQRDPRTLKVTTTSQEWCGHTFTQLNLREDGYNAHIYSYFESEGDEQIDLGDVLVEDELWNTIRLNPDDLPTGEIQVVQGTLMQRLSHTDLAPQKARATLAAHAERDDLMVYTLAYPSLNRTLAIHFTRDFPHSIEGWTDTRRAGASEQTTRATKKERQMMAYWGLNGTADEARRAELGLD